MIWITRGRRWGFRFLLDGGFEDPLRPYEEAFGSESGEAQFIRHRVGSVAVRLLDPERRKDRVGRTISHDFVVFGDHAEAIASVEDALRVLWPRVADFYGENWDRNEPAPFPDRG